MNRLLIIGSLGLTALCVVTAMTYSAAEEPAGRVLAHDVYFSLNDASPEARQALGVRARRRLEASEDFEDLLLLAQCDDQGRQRGVEVPDVEDALEYLRELAAMCNG